MVGPDIISLPDQRGENIQALAAKNRLSINFPVQCRSD